MFGAMWMYLAIGFGVLLAFNLMFVAVLAFAAKRTETADELRPHDRARLITYV